MSIAEEDADTVEDDAVYDIEPVSDIGHDRGPDLVVPLGERRR